MSELQREAIASFSGGRVYAAILAIYSSLPDRFRMKEVERKAGLKGPGSMYSAIQVLERSFHCTRTASGVWKKP